MIELMLAIFDANSSYYTTFNYYYHCRLQIIVPGGSCQIKGYEMRLIDVKKTRCDSPEIQLQADHMFLRKLA